MTEATSEIPESKEFAAWHGNTIGQNQSQASHFAVVQEWRILCQIRASLNNSAGTVEVLVSFIL